MRAVVIPLGLLGLVDLGPLAGHEILILPAQARQAQVVRRVLAVAGLDGRAHANARRSHAERRRCATEKAPARHLKRAENHVSQGNSSRSSRNRGAMVGDWAPCRGLCPRRPAHGAGWLHVSHAISTGRRRSEPPQRTPPGAIQPLAQETAPAAFAALLQACCFRAGPRSHANACRGGASMRFVCGPCSFLFRGLAKDNLAYRWSARSGSRRHMTLKLLACGLTPTGL
jgi:hypothetical protein